MMKDALKIGIFGGTFDPFTKAHEAIVKEALYQHLVDEVWIIPTVVDYHRGSKERWLSNDDRYAVISKFIDNLEYSDLFRNKVYVDKMEYEFATANAPYIVKKRRYIDTLNQFIYENEGLDAEYYTIIGTDSYKNFKTWTEWEEILKLSKLIVINGRDGQYIETDIPKIDLIIDEAFCRTSSSDIRSKYSGMSYEKYLADMFNDTVIERVKFTTPIFDFVTKKVEGLDFNPVGINSKDWVTMIVKYDDKFIMVKQLRYGLMKEQIEFPCGMVENNEEPIDAGIRELKEETGIKLLNKSQIHYLGKFAANPAFMNNYMHYFFVDLTTAQFVQCNQDLDAHEKLEIEFIPIEEVKQSIGTENYASIFMGMALMLFNEKCD